MVTFSKKICNASNFPQTLIFFIQYHWDVRMAWPSIVVFTTTTTQQQQQLNNDNNCQLEHFMLISVYVFFANGWLNINPTYLDSNGSYCSCTHIKLHQWKKERKKERKKTKKERKKERENERMKEWYVFKKPGSKFAKLLQAIS